MGKVMLNKAKHPETWGWNENPINGKEYDQEDIPRMYGSEFYEVFIDTDHFLKSWEDEEWDPEHGKWKTIDKTETPNG